MNSKALNSKNDLIIENGTIKMVSDAAEVVQSVRTRLQFFLGEWFLNTLAGTPYHQSIFIKPIDLSNTEYIMKKRILETPGIKKLNGFSMVYTGSSSRELTITFSADTIFGAIINKEVTVNA